MIPHSAWPVDPGVLLPFLISVALIELTPGPNMGWLALVAMARGRLAGMAAVAGVTLGLAVWMVAAAFGLTQVFAASPALYQALRWAGVAFMLWLAWEAWRGTAAQTDAAPVTRSLSALFLRGMVGNLLNPKAAVFYVGLLPTFMRPDHGAPLTQALTLGSLHLGVAVAVHSLIVLGGARAGQVLTRRMQGARMRAFMAAGLVAVALWLAWSTRAS